MSHVFKISVILAKAGMCKHALLKYDVEEKKIT